MLTGWGKTGFNSRGSTVLQEVTVKVGKAMWEKKVFIEDKFQDIRWLVIINGVYFIVKESKS